MDVVIDAQIVAAYYIEDILEKECPCTGSAKELFALLRGDDRAFLDAGGQMKEEWWKQARGAPEWFNAWYGDLLASGGILEIEVEQCRDLLQRLRKDHGFPVGMDAWYIRAAKSQQNRSGNTVALVTEDLDFYAPSEKGCKGARRSKILSEGRGAVANCLRRSESVDVRSVDTHLATS